MAFNQFSVAQPQMNDATGYAGGVQQGAIDQLYGLGNANNVIDAQLTGLRSGLDDIQTQGLNRIGDQAIQAGAFGGSRHGLAEASLGGEIAKAYTQGYGDIIANANRQSIDANNSAIAGAGQSLRDQLVGNYGGLQALAGILGSPTILSEQFGIDTGSAQSVSESRGDSQSGGFDLGFSAK